MAKCNVCGKKSIGGYKLCSSCRKYWTNKKQLYRSSKYKKTTSRKSNGIFGWFK